MSRLPEPHELDALRASVEFYEPKNLREMIEILGEAERACMAGQDEVRMQLRDEQRQRLREPHDGRRGIQDQLRRFVQVEFCVRWDRRILFLWEVRKLLEDELQSQEPAGGS
jgi:hypothetical protein